MCEAKVKKFFKIYPTKKEKTCGGDAGQSRGAGRGLNVKNYLQFAPIISNLRPRSGVYLLQRLACPPQVHLIR